MKFPKGEGSAVIHRKKKKQTCFTKTWHFDCLSSVFLFFIGNLLRSSSTQFLVVLFFIAFCTALFSSKHFRLELFVRSLFTQLFFLVVLFLLLLSMTAFSHVKAPFSLLCVTFFFIFFFAGPSSIQLFPYWFYSHQFAELGSIHRLAFSARACSLAFLCWAVLFLAISRAVLIYLVLFSGLF